MIRKRLAIGSVFVLLGVMTFGVLNKQAEEHLIPVEEIALRDVGEEIVCLRKQNVEIFKADSGRFTARLYVKDKYYYDETKAEFKEPDLSVKELSLIEKLNPFRKYDRYVDTGFYRATWLEGKPYDYTFSVGDFYVKYTALFDTSSIDIEHEFTADGVKETLIIRDGKAGDLLLWKVESNVTVTSVNNSLIFINEGTEVFSMSPLSIWDKSGEDIPYIISVAHDTLSVVLTISENTQYPITVDPTTTIYSPTTNGRILKSSTGYSSSRDATSGSGTYTGTFYLGQGYETNYYYVDRNFLSFDLSSIPSDATLTGASFSIYVVSDETVTDFNITPVAGTFNGSGTIATDWFNDFRGWASSGTYTTISYATGQSTSGLVTQAYNTITFNQAGLDSIKAHCGTSVRFLVTFLSSRDISNTTPTGWERFDGNGPDAATNKPYLSVTYATPPNPPTNFRMETLSPTSMRVAFTKNYSSEVTSVTIRNKSDNSLIYTMPSVNDTTVEIGSLSINNQYMWYARVDSAGQTVDSNADTLFTLAEQPGNVKAFSASQYWTKVGWNANGNPSGTNYGVKIKYPGGHTVYWTGTDTTQTATMKTLANWGDTVKVNKKLSMNTDYEIGVAGCNGNYVWTAWLWKCVSTAPAKDSVIVSESASLRGYAQSYLSARDTTVAYDVSSLLTVGQKKDSSDYSVNRSMMGFSIPVSFATRSRPDSVILFLDGNVDSSATDFSAQLFSSYHGISVETDDYPRFVGRQTVSTHNGVRLNNPWNTSNYSSEWNCITFNSTGIDSLVYYANSILRLAMVSSVDSSNTPPTGNEYITFENTGVKLDIWGANFVESAPSSVTLTPVSPTAIHISWTDNTLTEQGFQIVRANDDSLIASVSANIDSHTVNYLGVNTKHIWKVSTMGRALGDFISSTDSIYTDANVPGMPELWFPENNIMKFILAPNGNPSYTTFAVQDSITGYYIDATAEPETLRTELLGEWGWRTYNGWGAAFGDTLWGIMPGSLTVLRVKARSGE